LLWSASEGSFAGRNQGIRKLPFFGFFVPPKVPIAVRAGSAKRQSDHANLQYLAQIDSEHAVLTRANPVDEQFGSGV
jgi:hypothetical protein